MSEVHTAPAPARAVRTCDLPRCKKRLSDSNQGPYCRFHTGDEIEAYEKSLKKSQPSPANFRCVPCPHLSLEHLLELVCAEWNIPVAEVSVSQRGNRDYVAAQAKRIVMCLAAVDRSMTNRKIAAFFQLNVTGSISTCIANAKKEILNDPVVAEKVSRIRSKYPGVPA